MIVKAALLERSHLRMESRIENNPSLVEGVFRNQEDADHAIQELKQAGFGEEQISSKIYNVKNEGMPDTSRVVVAIEAGARNQEAADIFVRNGANNSDLPAGAALDSGMLVKDTTVASDDISSTSQGYEV